MMSRLLSDPAFKMKLPAFLKATKTLLSSINTTEGKLQKEFSSKYISISSLNYS